MFLIPAFLMLARSARRRRRSPLTGRKDARAVNRAILFNVIAGAAAIPLGQKIEAAEGIVPVRRSLVGRCAAIGMMQQRIADLPIFVLDCCESHSQKQAQLKVGAFEPQPSVYQN